MRVRVGLTVVVLVSMILAGCAGGGDGEPASTDEPMPPSSRPTWVFSGNGTALDASAFPGDPPTFEQIHVTDRLSGEPTVGVSRTGAVFYPAIDFDYGTGGTALPSTIYYRSVDGGATWTDVTPNVAGVNTHPTTFDPYVYVDPTTGRVFAMDMGPHVACNKVSWSDDDGRTWTTRDGACPLPVADHPSLFAGPKVGPLAEASAVTDEPTGYPNNVYLCSNQVADVQCSLSPDGGLTWLPSQPVWLGVDDDRLPPSGPEDTSWLCGSLTGHGHASWVDGTVYLGRGYCGEPQVGISRDGGLDWETVVISDDEEHELYGGHDVSIGTDAAGTAYAFWVAGEGAGVFLSTSTDQGQTWSEPLNVTAPGVTAAKLPSLVAGSEGRVAFQYVGTETPSGWAVHDEDENGDLVHPEEYRNATWNVYIGVSLNADAEDPVFMTTTVNDPDKPIKRGGCEGRCPGNSTEGGLYDFLDIDIDPVTGRIWSAIVDVCTVECDEPDADSSTRTRSHGAVGKQTGGTFLLVEPIPKV